MRLSGVCIFVLLLLGTHCQLLRAELQGPISSAESASTTTTATIDYETESASRDKPTDAPGTPSTIDDKDDNGSTLPAAGSSSTVTAPGGNDRKAAKLKDADFSSRTKVVPSALLERIWNDSLMKQHKLKAEIEALESMREPAKETTEAEQTEVIGIFSKIKAIVSGAKLFDNVALNNLEKLVSRATEIGHPGARMYLAFTQLTGAFGRLDLDTVAKDVEDLAELGVAEAHMYMGYFFSTGLGGKNVSQPMALLHYMFGALGNNALSQMAMGYRYLYGINVPTSCEKALIYYKRVAENVAAEVTFANGPMVHRVRLLDELENPGSQETEVVDYYQLLADKGDVQSQVGLGQLYYQGGKTITQDHQKALEYFTLAANGGSAIGFAFLGKLYLEGGQNIKADHETAFKYFSKASEMGDPVGQSGLGLMYLKGLGVPKDSMKALSYFTQAADQGWVDGQLQLGTMYFTGNGVKTDYKLALKYFNLATQSGHVLAYYNLGIMHAYGMGVMRSCPTAVEFFKNVAERGSWSGGLKAGYQEYKRNRIDAAFIYYSMLAEAGYEVAQSNAAFLLDRNEVQLFYSRREEQMRAFYYWKRAAAQGYSAAQVRLGDYYYYGWGTEQDFETAAALYRKASEQQYNAQAMFNLGYMHEQGLGMKKDRHLAKRLYDLAAETNSDAKVPVAMALFKLQMLTKIDSIKDSPYRFIFYMDENIVANWDLYLITVLTLLLGIIMYTRRPFQQPEQQVAQPQQQQAHANDFPAAAPNNANQPAPRLADAAPTTTTRTLAGAVPSSSTAETTGPAAPTAMTTDDNRSSPGASSSSNTLDPTD